MNALQSPILWLVIAGIVLLIVFATFRGNGHSSWGFKDVVKNPEYLDSVSHARADADEAAEAAKSWSDEKVASATKKFVLEATTSRDAWGEAHIMRELGERTHLTVLGLLRNTSLRTRMVTPTGTDLLPEAPFNRACDLLGDAPPAEAVEALAPFLKDSSSQIRKDAALSLAKTGARHIAPHVRTAFADDDEYVRSYALMGLQFAMRRSGLSENLREELFPDVQALLESSKNADKAADVLFSLNAERATEFFLSENVFRADSRIAHEALETLANAGAPVPRDRLLELIAALEAGELKYPKTYTLGEALRLLGQQQREEDRDFLLARTTHTDERVAEGASAGLLCSYGLEGFEKKIQETQEKSGYEALNQYQRFYNAVLMCDAEINNGGFAQYFLNSSGDNWHDAVAGFEAMGSNERLSLLKEAVAFFGSKSPSKDQDARQEQLSKLYRKNDEIFEDLDNRYYKSHEVVEVLVNRFVVANVERFR